MLNNMKGNVSWLGGGQVGWWLILWVGGQLAGSWMGSQSISEQVRGRVSE